MKIPQPNDDAIPPHQDRHGRAPQRHIVPTGQVVAMASGQEGVEKDRLDASPANCAGGTRITVVGRIGMVRRLTTQWLG